MSILGVDLLDRLLDACPAPVVFADLKGRILLFNPAAESVLGYLAPEARDHLHVTDLYHRPDDARRVLRRLRERASAVVRTRDTLDVTLRARNGELVPVRLHATLVHDGEGVPVGTLGVFEDRRENIALGRRLEDAASQVLESERRIAGMVNSAAVIHDISQPLTAAMGNIELLMLDEQLAPAVVDRLAKAWAQLERLGNVVHEVARVSATGRGSLPEDIA